MPRLILLALVLTAILISACSAFADIPPKHRTENVIFVMTDGLRWQEVFGGADAPLLTKENGGVADVDALKKTYWRDTPELRRVALMPFFWSVMATQGQVYGNRNKSSDAHVTNGKNFSYPGYNETFCGFPDPRINSNANVPNPNVTVFEWLHGKPKFQGNIAAFGAWDVFTGILNAERCGFPVNAGFAPLTAIPATPKLELLNRMKAEMPRTWEGEPYDALTFHTAMEYLKVKKPRVLYLSLGETDEWAHAGNYKEYLDAARRADAYLKEIWDTVQAMPQYRGKTTLIFTPDHGRGDAPTGWKSHGSEVEGSEFIWLGFLGPDTAPLGERANIAPVTQNQIAATLAAFLGADYCASVSQAGKPIADVLASSGKTR